MHSGKFSLQSRQLADHKPGFSAGWQQLPVKLIRGSHLQITAWMHAQNISNGEAEIKIDELDTNGKLLKEIKIPREGIHGSTKWRKYTGDWNISKEVGSVYVGIYHQGTGKVWFDDIDISVNGQKYDPSSYKPWRATQKEIQWLKGNIIPIAASNPDARFTNLEKIKPLFDGARVIGLGENTHGSGTFFRMKHRLIKWIASQNDSTVFVIEASMPEARAINQYVLHGKGNPKKLLANLHFWTWNTREVLNLIEWMRRYNQSGEGHIEFWGCDMQYPKVAADSVRAFIQRADSSYLTKLNHNYRSLSGPYAMRSMPQGKLDSLYHAVVSVLSHLRENRAYYLQVFDTTQVAWAFQNARIVEQSVARGLKSGESRDKSMAENIKWITAHHPSHPKIIIWAHNDHISRSSNNMGHYLTRSYGNDYRPVAFAFGEGTYSAVLGPSAPVKVFPAPPPIKGSGEYVMHQLDVPVFALDLRKARNNPDGQWLMAPKLFRDIGSVAEDLPYTRKTLAKSFDALIYFDHINASHSFGKPKN